MEYFLTEIQQEIRKLAWRFAQEKMKPVRAELDKTSEFPYKLMKELGDLGLMGVYIPEEYGGLGGGIMEMCLVVEELSRIDSGAALGYAASGLGTYPIILGGTKEQKKKYLPDLAAGKLAAFAVTEANAGSDVANVKTSARREGDYYVLNGTKQFTTNGSVAQIYTVIVSTNPKRGARGLSAFIVEDGTPGFSFGKIEDKMGIRSSKTAELVFEDCKVPAENLIGGKEGYGFIHTMKTFDRTRPGVGAQAVGIAQGALDEAVEYAKTRIQFGAPISSFQAVQTMLADMAIQVESARALVYESARAIDAGVKHVSGISSIAKVMASDAAMKVTTDAVQIFGGYGYMKDYPVEKMMRDAKITQIYEGTNQIQRLVIASELIKGTVW
ncbi:acyl-CoA dehydrogenase [candidate division WOR-3 bacterium JGI_Cruoil_03_51_56]|uniref:Acyl-CoA dehydrogenase n=1 Tax=candidate division WOR-3 bacterium JGI_Cruoil_03_51_56 TaxID=1973747 RepID=A0A235BQ78_UNCW3|nr:MAG: acyl-CoA dehydrogenase [candidate division WOR-3 bacterium JGI_Cruoil_03_51_56]